MESAAHAAAGPVVERFAPSAGRFLGYAGAVVGLVLAIGSAVAGVAANRGVLCFGVAVACLAWVVLIRPVAAAHENGVLLCNMLRDTFVPWSRIERLQILQTLQVVTPEATYHGLGVTRSARTMMKETRRPSAPVFGIGGGMFGRGYTPSDAELRAAQHGGGTSYQAYVESRLQDLATTRQAGASPAQPVVSLAPLSVVAMAVAAICVALIFVL